MNDLKTFYVTFGAGTLLANYYQEIHALNKEIVCTWMNKHYKGLWCTCQSVEDDPVFLAPDIFIPLDKEPKKLFYQSAEHI